MSIQKTGPRYRAIQYVLLSGIVVGLSNGFQALPTIPSHRRLVPKVEHIISNLKRTRPTYSIHILQQQGSGDDDGDGPFQINDEEELVLNADEMAEIEAGQPSQWMVMKEVRFLPMSFL